MTSDSKATNRRFAYEMLALMKTDPDDLMGAAAKNQRKEVQFCQNVLRGRRHSDKDDTPSFFDDLFVCSSDVLRLSKSVQGRYAAAVRSVFARALDIIGLPNAVTLFDLCLGSPLSEILPEAKEEPVDYKHSLYEFEWQRAHLLNKAVESGTVDELVRRCSPLTCCLGMKLIGLFAHITCRRRAFAQAFDKDFTPPLRRDFRDARASIVDELEQCLTDAQWMRQDIVLALRA